MEMSSAGKAKFVTAGALGSAVAASLCCLGPLLLALLGLGGGALLLKFEPLRPYLLAATGIFLGAAFYLTYRRPPAEECAVGDACTVSPRRRQKTVLWIVTLIVTAAAAFPYISGALF